MFLKHFKWLAVEWEEIVLRLLLERVYKGRLSKKFWEIFREISQMIQAEPLTLLPASVPSLSNEYNERSHPDRNLEQNEQKNSFMTVNYWNRLI